MKVTILGSTGSIGVSTLDVISYANSVGDQAFEVDALIGGRNASLLIEQAKTF
ncbi:MAG TPA: 1-deoxy-D-xylulose-5-phosphate reductoisomerase, partial [Hyphomonadaceae bacterium]|nr:1-deoxy-D-xylulose-5-phosphate reductoisomerase [Hyphomonadaceae bacterium]